MVNEEFDQFDTEWNNDMMPDFEGMGDWGRFSDPVVENATHVEEDSFPRREERFRRGNPNHEGGREPLPGGAGI